MDVRAQHSTLEESAIIERVARIVFSVRGTKPDYTRLAAELEQAVPFDIFGVVLLRHDRQAVRVVVCHRDINSWVSVPHQHPLAESMLEQVLQTPEICVHDYPDGLDGTPAESGDALSGHPQLRSTLIAPLVVEDRVLGTLELGSTVLHTYADESLKRLISAVVRVLAAAIESVQLGGNAAIQDRQREALKDVTTALTTRKDLSTILGQIVSGISSALNVASLLVLVDRHERVLHLEAQVGLDQQAVEQVFSSKIRLYDDCIISQTIVRRQALESYDLARDDHFSASRILFTELGLRSIYCYPLVTGSKVHGTLVLCSSEPGGFTPLKTDILALFANQATIAIHNGMLFESVHQRSRFQEMVEQLEVVHKQQQNAVDHPEPIDAKYNTLYAEEFALFEKVNAQTQQTFGVSFSSLLQVISEQLLTRNEHDLQSILYSIRSKQSFDLIEPPDDSVSTGTVTEDVSSNNRRDSFAGTLALLAQTSEDALMRTAMLGELSRLIIQLKQATNWLKDAWFVIDLKGYCSFMNPAAETLCDIRWRPGSPAFGLTTSGGGEMLLIEDVFTNLIPRMRNANEVCSYLQEFTRGTTYRQEVCCILAAEPFDLRTALAEKDDADLDLEENIRTDHYLQFMRYPLYTQQGRNLEAHALQIRDVTEQVRDEHNRSALLSSFSHDLRTPLTTIKAAVTGLLQTDVDWDEQDRLDMLEDINSEADHLTVLVNSLVELSRIEMGALNLAKEWCDVVEIFHGVEAKVKPILANRILRPQFRSSLPLVYADHVQLGRVFYNLIENAARHSPDQTEITICIDTFNDGQEKMRIQVIDQGPGIPVHERERIFTSYSQKNYGNVLGLAICKGIVQAHQGDIWVEVVEEQGSCFVFTLPIHPHSMVHVK